MYNMDEHDSMHYSELYYLEAHVFSTKAKKYFKQAFPPQPVKREQPDGMQP